MARSEVTALLDIVHFRSILKRVRRYASLLRFADWSQWWISEALRSQVQSWATVEAESPMRVRSAGSA